MKRFRRLWNDLNYSLWFVPTLLVGAAAGLAYGLVHLEGRVSPEWLQQYPMLFGAGADGARGMLTAIAGSMITVAGLIFSLTLSTLAQVSSQYTPRVLRNFMRDRANQLVLGSFVSIFVYCLIVLRTIRGGDEGRFIPAVAVAFGLVLALGSIGVLIFFIHHIAASIQAANMVARIADETAANLPRLFPAQLGREADPAEVADWEESRLQWHPVLAERSGYVQDIDDEQLLAIAREIDGVVRMERGIGSFVARQAPLLSVARYGAAATPIPEEELTRRLLAAYSLGRQRTADQDLGFGLRQLVDIALKALSPGINDTTTAVLCVDQLGALLSLLADRQLGEPLRAEAGRVRVVALRPTLAAYLSLAFDQIRTSADGNVGVLLRQLTALETIARRTAAPTRLAVLRQQTDLVLDQATRTLSSDYERSQVQTRYQQIKSTLDQ